MSDKVATSPSTAQLLTLPFDFVQTRTHTHTRELKFAFEAPSRMSILEMDPLSLSASVIAIATLAAQTCSALSNLRSLCENLPGRLHAVNNEVADLNLVLFQVSLLVQDRASLPETKASAIPHLLKQANIKLVEIKDIVLKLTVACGTSRLPIFRAHAWRTEQSRLQTLQDDVRAVKANLNIMLGASNSYA